MLTCGNFSDTSHFKFQKLKGSIGHDFSVCIRTENQNQVNFYPFVLHEISVLVELTLGHLCYSLTDVPPQPNSQPDAFTCVHSAKRHETQEPGAREDGRAARNRISKTAPRVAVFHDRRSSCLFYTSWAISQRQTRVKLNRVFFPR